MLRHLQSRLCALNILGLYWGYVGIAEKKMESIGIVGTIFKHCWRDQGSVPGNVIHARITPKHIRGT